jgi:hypothetical protein
MDPPGSCQLPKRYRERFREHNEIVEQWLQLVAGTPQAGVPLTPERVLTTIRATRSH